MYGSNYRQLALAALSVAGLLGVSQAASAQWQVDGPGGSSIKFGYLAQMRADAVDNGSDTATDLYFRRLRILAGGRINDQWTFFFETDSPNLGKSAADGRKNSGDMYMQDFVVSYMPGGDEFILDFGQLLGEVTYNSNQSAASLLATDYGPNSFAWAGPLDTRVGRDYGVRARGYLFNDRLEYRASILQGVRGAGSSNDMRFLGRLMFNVFEAQKGLFYTGTTLGKKQILSFGVSYDTQENYNTVSVDGFWDQPLAGGNAMTVQANWSSVDGDDFLAALPEQTNTFLEAGFLHGRSKLMPFLQYTEKDFDSAALGDVKRTLVGLAYWFSGHNGSVKFSYATADTDGATDVDEWWLQLQLFRF